MAHERGGGSVAGSNKKPRPGLWGWENRTGFSVFGAASGACGMMGPMKIQVTGAGSWGLALTRLLALNGHDVRLWCRLEDDPDGLRLRRENPAYLPGVKLPETVQVLSGEGFPEADLVVYAVPSHAMRKVAESVPAPRDTVRVSVAKGIEEGRLLRMSQVIAEAAPGGPVLALSGPSHAEETGRDLPAAVVLAGSDRDTRDRVSKAFFSAVFRVYTSEDITGVELGGALKNVIAIAAGACDGFELGDNARAALITRGLAEISRIGAAAGADPLTFAGLSGMGDLIVTCTSRHSRNHAVGRALAAGRSRDEIEGATPMVAEGVRTSKSARALARRLGVEMPVCDAVYRVLFEDESARDALADLLQREARPEKDVRQSGR
jgi:glycerol-3-phosphate dehydrogenase (NAD(P)+)